MIPIAHLGRRRVRSRVVVVIVVVCALVVPWSACYKVRACQSLLKGSSGWRVGVRVLCVSAGWCVAAMGRGMGFPRGR